MDKQLFTLGFAFPEECFRTQELDGKSEGWQSGLLFVVNFILVSRWLPEGGSHGPWAPCGPLPWDPWVPMGSLGFPGAPSHSIPCVPWGGPPKGHGFPPCRVPKPPMGSHGFPRAPPWALGCLESQNPYMGKICFIFPKLIKLIPDPN